MRAKIIAKKNNEIVLDKDLSEEEYENVLNCCKALEDFEYIFFLSTIYLNAKKRFESFDFNQKNLRETDSINILFDALVSICTNIDLWEAYLKRNFLDDEKYFSKEDIEASKKDKDFKLKSIFGKKDSQYYDTNILYAACKVIRNLSVHAIKPYSDILYFDDHTRHFVFYKRDFEKYKKKISGSAKRIILESSKEYYDLMEVIEESYKIIEKLNTEIFNMVLATKWINYYDARLELKQMISFEYDSAGLIWVNEDYPNEHILKVELKEISFSALNVILNIAAGNLMNKK